MPLTSLSPGAYVTPFCFPARRQSCISSCSFANPALDVDDLRYGKLCSDVLPFLSHCISSHKAFRLQSLTKTTHSEMRSDTHRSRLHLQLGWPNLLYIFLSRRNISWLFKHSGQSTVIYSPLHCNLSCFLGHCRNAQSVCLSVFHHHAISRHKAAILRDTKSLTVLWLIWRCTAMQIHRFLLHVILLWALMIWMGKINIILCTIIYITQ